MSRSGYDNDDYDSQMMNIWRGAVNSGINGKRGQAFLKEMLKAFDALPEPKLISNDLQRSDGVCAIGAVGKARGKDMYEIDPEDHEAIAHIFGISHALACEIMFENDERVWREETPEARFIRMRSWVQSLIHKDG